MLAMQSKLMQTEQSLQERYRGMESEWQTRLHNNEAMWMNRLQELEAKHEEQIKAVRDRLELETKAKDLAFNARLEAKEASITQSYEKKLLKFEKQVEEVQQTYKNKTLVIQGALEEARRECMSMQAAFTAKEDSWREELGLKDKRLVSIQARFDDTNRLERTLEQWQKLALELATMNIETCAVALKLPELMKPPEDRWKDVFRELSNGKDDKSKEYEDKAEEYNKLRKSSMAINRKQLVKLLKFSKVKNYLKIHEIVSHKLKQFLFLIRHQSNVRKLWSYQICKHQW